MSQETTLNLAPNVAGWLCYLGAWVSGIIIFVLEQKNGWIRFHAAQSIVPFGTLAVASIILGWIPVIGTVFSVIIGITGFILWIVLMVKAYNGERFKLAWAGDIAERMAGVTVATTGYRRPPESPRQKPPGSSPTAISSSASPGKRPRPWAARRRSSRIRSPTWPISACSIHEALLRFGATSAASALR